MRLTILTLPIVMLFTSPALAKPQPGDVFEIVSSYESKTSDDQHLESTSSARGNNAIKERVIAVSDAGIELEYDLIDEAEPDDRAKYWQYPVRLLKPAKGPMQLLNAAELEARVGPWLARASWTREMCGKWIFTWTAFKIECDPQAVVEAVADFDLRPGPLADRLPYQEPGTLAAVPLVRAETPEGVTYTAELQIDPNDVRRQLAQTDVVVASFDKRVLTVEEARANHANDEISGTVTITFFVDDAGDVWKKITKSNVIVKNDDGPRMTSKQTVTVERQRL